MLTPFYPVLEHYHDQMSKMGGVLRLQWPRYMQICLRGSGKMSSSLCRKTSECSSYSGKMNEVILDVESVLSQTFNGGVEVSSCTCQRRRGPVALWRLTCARFPVNFMPYLKTLHVLCLPCQTSSLPLIRRNRKSLTAAQISCNIFVK